MRGEAYVVLHVKWPLVLHFDFAKNPQNISFKYLFSENHVRGQLANLSVEETFNYHSFLREFCSCHLKRYDGSLDVLLKNCRGWSPAVFLMVVSEASKLLQGKCIPLCGYAVLFIPNYLQ